MISRFLLCLLALTGLSLPAAAQMAAVASPSGPVMAGPYVVVDAASGTSGAGRGPKASLHFAAVDGDFTAYGLLEFTDMAQVRQVDPAMLERTRKWLLDQRDGKGGYLRKTHPVPV